MPNSNPPPKKPTHSNPYPFWAPRFWHGMLLTDWLKLLAKYRFRIHPLRIPMALIVTVVAVGNSVLHGIQQLIYGKRVAGTVIEEPPIFIIGHWRSGTTMLHELIVLDPRFAYPTTYECFMANHFLLTGGFVPKIFWFLLPSKRPMDNMTVSFDHPQEDEFALVSMGSPSPILKAAFPNEEPQCLEFLNMQGVAAKDLDRWKKNLLDFVRGLTFRKRKRLVLKSPPHTGRVEVLSTMFPGAKFIHIVRNPETLFPSNRRLWQTLEDVQGFQFPNYRNLDEFVFTAFEKMYEGYESQRGKIPAGDLVEVRYEDLIADPLGEIQRLYEELNLDGFEQARPALEESIAQRKDYKVNRHELEPPLKQQISDRWGAFAERYGYVED